MIQGITKFDYGTNKHSCKFSDDDAKRVRERERERERER